MDTQYINPTSNLFSANTSIVPAENKFDLMDEEPVIIIENEFDDFEKQLTDIQNSDSSAYQIYESHMQALNSNLDEIKKIEENLIECHMDSGKHLCSLQEWFTQHFRTTKGWERFVLSKLNYSYSIRTAQRDMLVWRRLSPYRDILIKAGNAKLAISTVYFLSNPDNTSDLALEWALSLIEKHADVAKSAEATSTYFQLTGTEAKKIAATADFIETKIPEAKKAVIKEIAKEHNVSNIRVIQELAKEDDETLIEIKATGHIEYLLDTNSGSTIQKNVPISEASLTDIEIHRDNILAEKQQRQRQYRIQGAQEKEKRERGIFADFSESLEIPEVSDDVIDRAIELLRVDEEVYSAFVGMILAVGRSQASAGTRMLYYKLQHVETIQDDSENVMN